MEIMGMMTEQGKGMAGKKRASKSGVPIFTAGLGLKP
jgi:hypothetical protein